MSALERSRKSTTCSWPCAQHTCIAARLSHVCTTTDDTHRARQEPTAWSARERAEQRHRDMRAVSSTDKTQAEEPSLPDTRNDTAVAHCQERTPDRQLEQRTL
eukprot:1841828-Rhodomonas_salina.1